MRRYFADAEDLANAVSEWVVVFATNEGMVQRAYDDWILGQGAGEKQPRWSILRNVLGWTDQVGPPYSGAHRSLMRPGV